MLPVRLNLRNFMSYGEPAEEVDFRGFRLACISGNNGEGKSALLDAITWALWGVARGTDLGGRGADDLIRLGAEEAEVIFEFEVDDTSWRVIRSRRRGRAGGNVSLSRQSDGAWQDSSGATATLTQQHINSILGLDYQTFINSAFLLQGRADEFARQGAGDRKRILGDILGLGLFDVLSKRARETAKREQDRADFMGLEIERLSEDVSREPELQRQAEVVEVKLAEAKTYAAETRKAANARQESLTRLEEKQRQTEEVEQRLRRVEKRREDLRQERDGAYRKVQEYERLLARQKEIEEGFSTLMRSREAEGEWREKADRFKALSHQRELHSLKIAQEKRQLEDKAKWLREQAQSLSAKSEDRLIREKVGERRAEIASLESRLQQASEIEQALRAARDNMARLIERQRQLESLLAEKRESLALLQQAEAACPVCRSQLSEERRLQLIAELKKELEETTTHLEGCRQEAAQAKTAAVEQEKRLRQLERERGHLADLKHELGQYENMLSQAQAAKEQYQSSQKELEEIEERLQKEEFAAGARAGLLNTETEIAALAYDAQAHRAASEEVQALLSFEAEKRELERAQAALEAYREALRKAEQSLAAASAEIDSLQEDLEKMKQEAARLPQARAEFADLSRKAEAAEEQVMELDKTAAVLKKDLSNLAESRRLLSRRQQEREEALERAVVHNDLAAAFGKNGVQALIIETTLPQLEQHTNELLDRLTEGRMKVSFHTQKEKASSGEMAETLEIRIRDESGERRYEMYSGGEAFRLNFAIRLALSRLLTQRAGAKLSTLVIDEGFGSQDVEGRQRLVEAIHAVAEDFDRILVITHLDELKAEFPHRIEVSKDESGSHIRQAGLGNFQYKAIIS
jgi:exonuclease SbcC